jgi:two-component system, LytTR family, sensor kinase
LSGSFTILMNLVGYVTGAALYATLLAVVFSETRQPNTKHESDWLPLLTACAGLVWNVGSLIGWGVQSFSDWPPLVMAFVMAFTFAALGLLPALVVHSVLRQDESSRAASALIAVAYALSFTAGVLHFAQAALYREAPSHWGLHLLTYGFVALIGAVLFYTQLYRKGAAGRNWKRITWVIALAVFAVSALHLSHHEGQHYAWWVELIGHHASLLLALAILYQDYRFALADLFLKRALTVVLLIAVIVAAQQWIVWPTLQRHAAHGPLDPLPFGVLLSLWLATALLTPWLWRAASWFVNTIVLRRTDYEAARAELAAHIAASDTPDEVLQAVSQQLQQTLAAHSIRWETITAATLTLEPQIERANHSSRASLAFPRAATTSLIVPTTEAPQYQLLIGELAGGRRLLSDDLALLSHASLLAARRIDALRVMHERCLRDLHEQEMHQLATEAELRALRAQINPHFLFNALTTIGYLIQAAPEKALDTLLRLTSLLRGVLRRTEGEFVSLGEEISLIEAYLDIERTRFEDRLRVLIDVPTELRSLRIPALLIQPLVENAIKHGIAPQRNGGEVVVLARLEKESDKDCLKLWVRDTGAGASDTALQTGRARGVGLSSIERRLLAHYGNAAQFDWQSATGLGTTVTLTLPINTDSATLATTNNVADFASAAARRKTA